MPEDDRALMLAEDEMVCPKCGNLRSECSDPAIEWIPQREICYPTADRELTMRRLQAKFKNKTPGTAGLHPFDGVTVWMARDDFRPDEKFFDLAAQQPPGQHHEADGEAAQGGDADE